MASTQISINKNPLRNVRRPISTRFGMPPRRFGPPVKNVPAVPKENFWDLKDAGKAILIATFFLIVQILVMFWFNLSPGASGWLGLFLFLLFGIILFFVLSPIKKLKRFK